MRIEPIWWDPCSASAAEVKPLAGVTVPKSAYQGVLCSTRIPTMITHDGIARSTLLIVLSRLCSSQRVKNIFFCIILLFMSCGEMLVTNPRGPSQIDILVSKTLRLLASSCHVVRRALHCGLHRCHRHYTPRVVLSSRRPMPSRERAPSLPLRY